MGDLISFRPTRNAARAKSVPPHPQGAQILFFTGVRYKRGIELPPAPLSTRHDIPPKGGMDGAGGGRRKRRG
jgi:hypothetical protein